MEVEMKETCHQKTNIQKINVHEILKQWNLEVPESILQQQSRRSFLTQSMGLIGGVAIGSLVVSKVQANSKSTLLDPWLTIAAVQEHLFPAITGDNVSPGANEINALAYLQVMLNAPDADSDEKKFIKKGVSWLNGVSNNSFGQSFLKLNKAKREQVLQIINKSESGTNWLSTLLRYIFEALLTDPIYSGNKNKQGWQWLEHQAGFPRPPENKKYWLLK